MIIAVSSRVKDLAVTDDEQRLFGEFVRVRKADNRSPESAPVDGISTRTLRRYIVDGEVPARLEEDTKAAMATFLASRGVGGFERFVPKEPVLRAATDEELIDLGDRLDQIENSDLDPILKIVKIEAVAAAIRAEQARHEAVAAAIRARAIEKAESSAESRAKAIERAEESAAVRASTLRGEPSSDLTEALYLIGDLVRQSRLRGEGLDGGTSTERPAPDAPPPPGGP